MAEFVGNWYLRFRSPISSSRTGQKIRQEPEKLKEHTPSHADGKCGNKKSADNFWHHILAQFSMAFQMVWLVLFWLLALEATFLKFKIL